MMILGKHHTIEGLEEIKSIESLMNKSRKNYKL